MKLKFGIMGAGGIAVQFAKAISLTDCAEVLAVSSKSIEKAKDFAKKNNIPLACTYDEMLSLKDIDVVYIATTTNFHYENIKMCLMAGKHVICEKSMVTNSKDAKEVFDLASSKGLFLMEAMWSRFTPSINKAKKWILDGKIGKMQSVSAVVGFKSTRDPSSRLLASELGGGALFDIGVYAIELITYLVGEPIKDVIGYCRKNSLTGVDENNTFILNFESVDAGVKCLFTSPVKEYIIVSGEDGVIEIPCAHMKDECFLYNAEHELIEHFKEEFPSGNGFVYEIKEVVNCIKSGKITSDIVPPYATIECAEIFDKLLNL